MDINKLTQKSREAVQDAQALTIEYGNTQIEQAHLLLEGKGLLLQGGELRLVKVLLGKAPGDGPVQHGVQPPEGAPPGHPLPEAEGQPGGGQGQKGPGQGGHFPTSQV